MPEPLEKSVFTEDDVALADIQSFSCGSRRWDIEVSTWIKSKVGPDSAIQDMRTRGTEVWIYRTTQGELVGFGSLGENTMSFPLPKGKKKIVNYIPFLGVHERFQGKPENVGKNDRYAYQILDDLIETACNRPGRHPAIVLSVDTENTKAIAFYRYKGFVIAEKAERIVGDVKYERMFLNIAQIRNEQV